MFSPLTPAIIKKFNKIHLSEIKAVEDVDDSMEFWSERALEIDYKTFVYLTMHYIMGDLYSTPSNLGPIAEDHEDARPALRELALEGILTSGGQSSIAGESRSYLDFEFPIEENQIDRACAILKTLYAKGLNVFAVICEYDDAGDGYDCEDADDYELFWQPVRNIILFKSPEMTIDDTNASTMTVGIPRHLRRVTNPGTHMHSEYTHRGYHCINRIVYPSNYLVRVCVFNQEWDMIQADQIVLETVRELKNADL